MTTETTVEEDTANRLSSIADQLGEAQRAVEVAQESFGDLAGRHLLGEADDAALSASEEALTEAKRHAAALASAQKVLTARAAAQSAQTERERLERLRQESAVAAKAQDKALQTVAVSAERLAAALSVVKAQGAVIAGLYKGIAEASPEQAAEIEADHRDDLARIGTIFAAKKGAVREAASSGQYRVQDDGTGSDRTVEADLSLLDEVVVPAGTKTSAARGMVLEWEFSQLSKLDHDLHEAQQEAFADHASRTEIGLGAFVGASLEEVRNAANLDVDDVALLISDQTARSLAGLTSYLPSSVFAGVSVRSGARTALEAKQEEARLSEGVKVLRGLVGG